MAFKTNLHPLPFYTRNITSPLSSCIDRAEGMWQNGVLESSQLRTLPATCVPECHDFDAARANPIVEVIVNAVEMDTSNAGQPDVRRESPNDRLLGYEIEGSFKLFLEVLPGPLACLPATNSPPFVSGQQRAGLP